MPLAEDNHKIVTRFAPSPTGYLHIGGARTALFNWLYARGRGGKFYLRIEDTDRARHNEAAVSAILDGLKWLGLDYDGAPVSQYARRARHVEAVNQLLAEGKAYKCFLAPAEADAAREQARARGERFESIWRERDPAEAPSGATYTVRFKAPRTGHTTLIDMVQGEISFPNAALDDLILLRSNNEPTYNLAVVVDDHDMGVTHVIRGDDHLNNAARQQQIYEALNWSVPHFAHVPLIHGADGAKLSKRHGALGVEAYRDMGYLAEGLANYLLRLGWSHGDDEIISSAQALQWFDVSNINKSPARLDLKKLNHVNAHYITLLNDDAFLTQATPFFERQNIALDPKDLQKLSRAASFLKLRCATLADAPDAAAFLFLKRPIAVEGKAAKPLKKEGAGAILREAMGVLNPTALWKAPDRLEAALQEMANAKNIGFGAIGAPLRAALTGGFAAPSLGEVLYSIGREEALARISDFAA